MTEEAHTTIAPATASRRAVLTGIAAVPLAAVPFAFTAGADPLLVLLEKRRAILRELNSGAGDISDEHPLWLELEAVQEALIGMPALTAAGALLAVEDVIAELKISTDPETYRDEAVDISLLQAAAAHLRFVSA